MNNKKRFGLVLLATCVILASNQVLSQSIPNGFNYQGEVYDASGQPLESGNYDIKFALYLEESDQQPLWGPVNYRLPVYKGVFNVVLEGDDVVAAFDQGAELLELTIGTNPPIQPRQRILSVPYAMRTRGIDFQEDEVSTQLSMGKTGTSWGFRVNSAVNAFQLTDFNRPGRPPIVIDNEGVTKLGPDVNGHGRLVLQTFPDARVEFLVDGANGDFEIKSNDTSVNSRMMHVKNSSKAVTFYGDVFVGSEVLQKSDARLKTNIRSLPGPIDTIQHLRGVKYEWRNEQTSTKKYSSGDHVGVIAQEVEEVLPEAVKTNPEGYKYVDYSALTPVLIEAIKAQQKMIEELQIQVRELKGISTIVE